MLNEYRDLIFASLKKIEKAKINIYTYALYHDHESGFVSVCIDTKDNSLRSVQSSNDYVREKFITAIGNNDLKKALLWQCNAGRNFSLGNFKYINIEEIKVPLKPKSNSFYLDMVKAIEEMSELIIRHSSYGKELAFCCSTKSEEVGLIWCSK